MSEVAAEMPSVAIKISANKCEKLNIFLLNKTQRL